MEKYHTCFRKQSSFKLHLGFGSSYLADAGCPMVVSSTAAFASQRHCRIRNDACARTDSRERESASQLSNQEAIDAVLLFTSNICARLNTCKLKFQSMIISELVRALCVSAFCARQPILYEKKKCKWM